MYRLISCGVDSPPGGTPLRFAEQDALNVANTFTSSIGPLQPEDVVLLRGHVATADQLLAAFLSAGQPEHLVFYFSGHGGPHGLALADGQLSYENLSALIGLADATNVFVILDSCSAGSALGQFKEASVGGVGMPPHWAEVLANATPGTRLVFSTGAGRAAGESSELRGGVFTHYFLRALRQSPADLSHRGYQWVSDANACRLAAGFMEVMEHDQLPEYHGLTGDFPMTLSQYNTTIGEAAFLGHKFAFNTLNVDVAMRQRQGLCTVLAWSVSNGRGMQLDAGTLTTTGTYSDFTLTVPYPEESIEDDPYTRWNLQMGGMASLWWDLEIRDEFNRVLRRGRISGAIRRT